MTGKLITQTLVCLCLLVLQAKAQNCNQTRYRDAIFDSITVERDIIFANAPSITPVYLSEAVTVDVDLKMDVFQPYGDTLEKRPAYIMAFGGAFLIGDRNLEDVQSLCDSLAHRGYVSVAFDYRLGMNVLNGESAERAVYRAGQDYSAVVRYLKEHADVYGIDTNYIFVGGISAGAIAALHMAYIEDSQRPASSFAKPGIINWPDLGCGNCSGNNFDHSRKVRGIVNCWGAIGDLQWIDSSDTGTPLISFHGDQDGIVPYGCGFPFTALFTLPQVCGSSEIKVRTDALGIDHEFIPFPGEGHNIWGVPVTNGIDFPNQNYPFIFNKIIDFLYRNIQPEPEPISGPAVICKNSIATYSVNPHAGSQYCWEAVGGTIVYQSPDGATIEVLWDTLLFNQVSVTEVSHLLSVGETQVKQVDVLPVPEVEADNGASICPGEGVILQGQATHSFVWSHGDLNLRTRVAPLQSTWYYLVAYHPNGCITSDSVYIEVYPQPQLSVNSDTICAGEQAIVSANGDAVDYQWSNGSQTTTLLVSPTYSTSYSVTVTSADGCTGEGTAQVQVNVCTGIEAMDANNLIIQNQPFDDKLVIQYNGSEALQLTLYDITGKKVLHQRLTNGINTFFAPDETTGIYVYAISRENIVILSNTLLF